MALDILKAPDCPHLYKNTCLRASNVLGTRVIVTPPVCNVSCQKHGGPYCGKVIDEPQTGKWAKEMLRYAWGASVQKVADRYAKPIKVAVPDCVDRVKAAFSQITALPWVQSIGLTGSILSPTVEHKDIDVMLIVSDLRQYIDAADGLSVPKEIDGLHVDLFVSEQECTFFMTLDLNSLKLYKSGLYNVVEIDPRIVEVIDTGKEIYATFRDPHREIIRTPTMLERFHAWWAEFHKKDRPNEAWLDAMIRRIPCGECVAKFKALLKKLPPRFDDWPHSSFEIHNAVRVNLNQIEMNWADACARWGWK